MRNDLDPLTCTAIAQQLAVDSRIQRITQLGHLLDEMAKEIARLNKIRDELPVDVNAPEAAMELVAAFSRSKHHTREDGRLDILLQQARIEAIGLGRSNGLLWRQIGDALGEAGQNINTEYNNAR